MNKQKLNDCNVDNGHPHKRQRRDNTENIYYGSNISRQQENNGTANSVGGNNNIRLGNSTTKSSLQNATNHHPSNALVDPPLNDLIDYLRYDLGTGNKCPVEVGYSM